MILSKISSKGQITLTKAELAALNVSVYSYLEKKIVGGILYLTPLKTSITDRVSDSLTAYVPAYRKKNVSLKEINTVTQSEAAQLLMKKK